MQLKQITLGKEFKVGLANFSNLTLQCHMTWDIGLEEVPDFDSMWESINSQLSVQVAGLDSDWVVKKEYTNFFKTVVKQTHREGGEQT